MSGSACARADSRTYHDEALLHQPSMRQAGQADKAADAEPAGDEAPTLVEGFAGAFVAMSELSKSGTEDKRRDESLIRATDLQPRFLARGRSNCEPLSCQHVRACEIAGVNHRPGHGIQRFNGMGPYGECMP